MVFNILNKPIIQEKCVCNEVHQLCEQCFKNQCLIELKMDSAKSNFLLVCPITFQEKALPSDKLNSKEMLFEHFLFPLDPKEHALPEYKHCFLKINQNLIAYIY